MKSFSLFLIYSLVVLGHLNAQESFTIKGAVLDAVTQEKLVAVNIFDQQANSGTFSDISGQFEIKVKQFPTTLVFSFLGYKNYLLNLDQAPEAPLQITLDRSILSLPDIEVIAEPKVKKLTQATFSVKDFIIDQDKVLLIKYGGSAIGNFLELQNLEGQILHSLPVKVKGIIEYMHQSCLGNIHLVGSKEAIEISISSNQILLLSKYPRAQFDRLLKPCIDASDDYVYFKAKKALGQLVRYDFISKSNNSIQQSVVISDQENISRMGRELGASGFADNYYNVENQNIDPFAEFTRPEEFDAWKDLFYKPLFSPLYNTGEEICLFNHTLSCLRFYTFDGQLKRQLPINYHKEKKWDKKVLKDKKTGKFYTVYKDAKGKKFYEINLQDGTVSPAFKIDCAFIEKMVLYDGYLYYQDSGVLAGSANRILHKVKADVVP